MTQSPVATNPKKAELFDLGRTKQQIDALKHAFLANDDGKAWLENAKKFDPMLRKMDDPQIQQVMFESSGLTAIVVHREINRLQHDLAEKNGDLVHAEAVQTQIRHLGLASKLMSGIDLPAGARIAPDVFIDHGLGVVIGNTASIGEGSFILHGVTLGNSMGRGNFEHKEIEDKELPAGMKRRHPKIGKNVMLGTRATVLGPCTIGDNVTINEGATLIDCELGEGVKIGANVKLRGAKIPPYAEVHAEQSPLAVIYHPGYENRIVPFKIGKDNEKQSDISPLDAARQQLEYLLEHDPDNAKAIDKARLKAAVIPTIEDVETVVNNRMTFQRLLEKEAQAPPETPATTR